VGPARRTRRPCDQNSAGRRSSCVQHVSHSDPNGPRNASLHRLPSVRRWP
jgi:hypothetical protein